MRAKLRSLSKGQRDVFGRKLGSTWQRGHYPFGTKKGDRGRRRKNGTERSGPPTPEYFSHSCKVALCVHRDNGVPATIQLACAPLFSFRGGIALLHSDPLIQERMALTLEG